MAGVVRWRFDRTGGGTGFGLGLGFSSSSSSSSLSLSESESDSSESLVSLATGFGWTRVVANGVWFGNGGRAIPLGCVAGVLVVSGARAVWEGSVCDGTSVDSSSDSDSVELSGFAGFVSSSSSSLLELDATGVGTFGTGVAGRPEWFSFKDRVLIYYRYSRTSDKLIGIEILVLWKHFPIS